MQTEVEPAPAAIASQTRIEAITMAIDERGAESDNREFSLDFRISRSEGEQVLDLRGFQSLFLQVLMDFLGRGYPIQVNQHEIYFVLTSALKLKTFVRNVVIEPVVLASLDHLGQGHAVVHRDLKDRAYAGHDKRGDLRGQVRIFAQ